MKREIGFLLDKWMKSFSWMTARIQQKGIGDQQVLAAHKGANSPKLVQSRNDLSCRTGKACYPVIKKGTCPQLPARQEYVGQCQCWESVQMCLHPGRKGRSGLLLVMQEQ